MKLKKEKTPVEKEIDEILYLMEQEDPLSDEYRKYSDALSRLLDIKRQMKRKMSVSPDTIAIIAANLLGIALVLGYEQAHVITSKAFGFISKLRF